MIQDHKHELWKAEKHAYALLQTIDKLQDEMMPPRRYAETMGRLRKQAGLMAQRLSGMTNREVSMIEKMNFESEYYGIKP